jgi:hypothetical protein
MRGSCLRRFAPVAVTAVAFAAVLHRVPLARLLAAFEGADYARFLAAMIPNTIVYFCWDTLVLATVLRWFHGPVPYRDLLPVRAASYVVGLFNTNAGRGALALYLTRTLGTPFLQLGSTVLFLVLTEYLHLVGWASIGLLVAGPEVSGALGGLVAAVAALWLLVLLYSRWRIGPSRLLRWLLKPQGWAIFRTFRLATIGRYGRIVALRAPMFFASLCFHYLAAPAFGLSIPFGAMMVNLPIVFMIAALPITVAHLGTTQAAWLVLFRPYGPPAQLVAFSLAAHLTFTATRALLGLVFVPRVYADLVGPRRGAVAAAPGSARVHPPG